jgi:hypothetical protein
MSLHLIDGGVAEVGNGRPTSEEVLVDDLRHVIRADVGVPNSFRPCGIDHHVGAVATLTEAAAEGDANAALCVAVL